MASADKIDNIMDELDGARVARAEEADDEEESRFVGEGEDSPLLTHTQSAPSMRSAQAPNTLPLTSAQQAPPIYIQEASPPDSLADQRSPAGEPVSTLHCSSGCQGYDTDDIHLIYGENMCFIKVYGF
jgi:hypothetical protein